MSWFFFLFDCQSQYGVTVHFSVRRRMCQMESNLDVAVARRPLPMG